MSDRLARVVGVVWICASSGCQAPPESVARDHATAAAEPAPHTPALAAMSAQTHRPAPTRAVVAWTPQPDDLVAPVEPLEDPSGHALDAFYSALARVEAGENGAKARVLHLGDSSLGLDGLPHAVRSRMQARFGDAGPGFLLLQRYSPSYLPKTVAHHSNEAWNHCYIAYKCLPDGYYGLGGVAFRSQGGASTTLILPKTSAPLTEVELWYAGLPSGGRLELTLDDDAPVLVETAADALVDRWHRMEADEGVRRVQVRARGGGNTRAYGVVLERAGPGVVWDAVSMVGAFTRRLHAFDPEHAARQVAHRDPDLLVLTYGGNDLRRVVAGGLTGEVYEAEYDETLSRIRAGKPDVPCLITSVIDHGRSGEQTVESHHVEVIVEAQRRLAAKHGCAFFDTYAAMGGAGSIHRWRKQQPALASPDLKHLNRRGQDVMGENIYRAIMSGYVEWRTRGAAPDHDTNR